MTEVKNQLNKEQEEAVFHANGPLLIVAGAGTGKTTVITERIANIINKKLANSDEILALTFTEKAAGEMEERIDKLLPLGYFDLWVSTFHSFGEKMLRENGLDIGIPTDFKLLNEFEQYSLFKKNLDKFDLDYYMPMGNPTKFIRTLLKHFSRAKDEDISAEEYLKYADELKQNLDGMLGGGKSKKVVKAFCDAEGKFDEEIGSQEVTRINEVANAYHVYQNLLLENSALDFGDLINYCLKLFRERPNILEKYRKKFKYILLDEFQDTNLAQYELIKILVAPKNNITVVGDDDQCLPGDSLVLIKDGKKRIDKIKKGEEVATAVGRGHLSYSRISKVMKNKKKAKLLTFKTKKGNKIIVTDNHKMFCFIPVDWHKEKNKRGEFYYVYLMHKQELGWRIGITKNISIRLKLERLADRIVVVNVFKTEEEARYHETFYALKYGIPTGCFMERNGMMDKKEWSEKLYQNLAVDNNVLKIAKDLNIDLDAHQFCLDAVNRGSKVRIKIILEMCSRNYRSKNAKSNFLKTPQVLHLLSLETTHKETIKKLEKEGFKLTKAKKGKRLRISSADLGYLGKQSRRLQKITGGIIENRAKIGKTNIQSRKALVIPAKNVLPGMFMPVLVNNEIIYEQIISRSEKEKILTVYDLEVEKTHNFIANNFVVHNSIYKFRGASMGNILQFRDDFPKAKQIFLKQNYRNKQDILDLSYDFVNLNNPNRLEYQFQQNKDTKDLNKKLISNTGDKGEIEVIEGIDSADEIAKVVNKIAEIKTKDKEVLWSDFAILTRANEHAREITAYLDEAKFPYLLFSSRGLYTKEVIINVVSYLKALVNYYNNANFFKILTLPIFNFNFEELISYNYLASKKGVSLYQVLNNPAEFGISLEKQNRINAFLTLFKKHANLVKDKHVSDVILAFINDTGYLKFLLKQDEKKAREATNFLNKFMKRVKEFEQDADDKGTKAFLDELEVEIEAGEQGSLPINLDDGPDTIKIMTVHASKGLEFKYVFITNLVDKRFPTTEKKEPILLPDELVKETLPEGEHHLEEERRLFYVAITRARDGVFFSWTPDCGGKRAKRPSRFLVEAKLIDDLSIEGKEQRTKNKEQINLLKKKSAQDEQGNNEIKLTLPKAFSYTQVAAFSNCPYQYRFAHILKIPVRGKVQFSFGKTMHSTMQKIFDAIIKRGELKQDNLFTDMAPPDSLCHSEGAKATEESRSLAPPLKLRRHAVANAQDDKKEEKDDSSIITLDECLRFYEESWIDEWYDNEGQKEKFRKKGKDIVKDFYKKYDGNWPEAINLEKGFFTKVKVDGEFFTLRGQIDRVDKKDGKIKIVDYKTGSAKEKLQFRDKEQLLIYYIAVKELFKEEIGELSFYYLENNTEVNFEASVKDIEKIREKTETSIRDIKKAVETNSFKPIPGPLCSFCDYKDICEFRKI